MEEPKDRNVARFDGEVDCVGEPPKQATPKLAAHFSILEWVAGDLDGCSLENANEFFAEAG